MAQVEVGQGGDEVDVGPDHAEDGEGQVVVEDALDVAEFGVGRHDEEGLRNPTIRTAMVANSHRIAVGRNQAGMAGWGESGGARVLDGARIHGRFPDDFIAFGAGGGAPALFDAPRP